MQFAHATLWIGPRRARVLHFGEQSFPTQDFVRDIAIAMDPGRGLHVGALLAQVCKALADTPQVLVTGTPDGIAGFEQHLAQTEPRLRQRIVGVQQVAEPTDERLSALSRWHFTRVQPLPADMLDA